MLSARKNKEEINKTKKLRHKKNTFKIHLYKNAFPPFVL